MRRNRPQDTKLVICTWHSFTEWRAPATLVEPLRKRWPRMKVVYLPDYAGLEAELPDTDIFVGWSLRAEQFRVARQLKWIHATAAGVNQLMYPELIQSPVVITNSSGIHAITMAEHTIGVLVALARHFAACTRHQMRHEWAQQDMWDSVHRPRELSGATLLIVGFGDIGREVARRARPFGMRIWGVTRSGRGDRKLAERILPASKLSAALPSADFIVLAAPETPETHHLIGAAELELMKPSAFLVNIARGSIIDETALIGALEQRRIAGAALDVADREPLPPESPLWSLENVFITPHVSGVSERMWERQATLLMANLERWFTGKKLLNVVDRKRGY